MWGQRLNRVNGACLDLIFNGDGARACVICERHLLFRVADNAAGDERFEDLEGVRV
jgi:hypothetical protein